MHFVAGQDADGYDSISKLADAGDYHGKWNHWTFSKNATIGSMKIYLNGLLFHELSGNTRPIQSATAFSIGGYAGGGSYKGKIDEFRVYDYQLSDDDVLKLYTGELVGGSFGAGFKIPGDITMDQAVDLADFARIAAEWVEN